MPSTALCRYGLKLQRGMKPILGRVNKNMVLLPECRWLEIVPDKRSGRPTVKGTRVSVDDILEMLVAGWKLEEIAEELEIPLEAIYEALRFASEALKRVTIAAEASS